MTMVTQMMMMMMMMMTSVGSWYGHNHDPE
jgi:hypothetical protein